MTEVSNKQRFLNLLDTCTDKGKPVQFWWRDDDAFETSQNLEQLIGLAENHSIPLALAVIPKNATADLAERVSKSPNVTVLTHGYSHRNHADSESGQSASEFGENRPIEECLQDLQKGFTKITDLFGAQSLPILVPPWNRIGNHCLNRISEVGFEGYSCFGSLTEIKFGSHQMDVHWDPMKWGDTPRFCGESKAWQKLNEEISRRENSEAPIGIMTHHLAHDRETWNFLKELFELLSNHPGANFASLRKIFGFK